MKLLIKKPISVAPTLVPLVKPIQSPKSAPTPKPVERNLDELAALDIGNSANLLVPWYLMSSYLYYVRDVSILSDGYYDRICAELLRRFIFIRHFNKDLVNKGALAAGTGYNLPYHRFPVRIMSAANRLAHDHLGIAYPNPVKEKRNAK
ncbi:putative NAD-dependent DNA ligase protein [Rhizobium phage RHph_Y1_11]|nr:putative NAD-dependent DNA ligase protein [Rhizobium phage RHph_Y1_11]